MQIVRIVILTLCCLVFATAKAQIDTQFSQYWALPGYYNPAAAGSSDKLNILTSTRQQWIGMPGAPQTYFVTGDMPFKFLKQNHGWVYHAPKDISNDMPCNSVVGIPSSVA